MSEVIIQSGATRILYDEAIEAPDGENWLLPDRWRESGAVTGILSGRGTAWRVSTPAGEAVLRRFLRGGQIARFNRDRYLYTGWARSRAFREWRLLRELNTRGLPVPRPLAASCERSGIWYRAGLMTEFIPDTQTLAERLQARETIPWQGIGATIRRFCQAGVAHADLNIGNILLDGAGRVWVIDFDRARLRAGPISGNRMLARLRRSLDKFGHSAAGTGWADLLQGRCE